MSSTFTLQGKTSVLSEDYYPPIELKKDTNYGLALIGLYTYNTIPNVVEGNNKFYYDDDDKVITIPVGSYEINNIEEYINDVLKKDGNSDKTEKAISLKANNNTLQCEINSKFRVNFKHADSIGVMLGFSPKILTANDDHKSDLPVQIIKVVTIRVECSITTAAYHNAQLSHTIYEFSPQVEPGFRIIVEPQHVIYLPINKRNFIDNITITLLDQDGRVVNFRDEHIVVRLELKEL